MYCGVPKNRAARSAPRPNGSSPKALRLACGIPAEFVHRAAPPPPAGVTALHQCLDPAAVHSDALSRDVARALRDQEGRQRRELGGLAEPPHRDLRLDSSQRFGGLDAFATRRSLVQLDRSLGTRVALENRVDGDSVLGDL